MPAQNTCKSPIDHNDTVRSRFNSSSASSSFFKIEVRRGQRIGCGCTVRAVCVKWLRSRPSWPPTRSEAGLRGLNRTSWCFVQDVLHHAVVIRTSALESKHVIALRVQVLRDAPKENRVRTRTRNKVGHNAVSI